ncbi:endoribonuclease L-PSP [Treponema primitia ZAS-2]|uniref:Endoribonuclease L-PSP n=1 Tax=Treponema primitia (strain ATCC BAA-887 / DSM 12427 / ZAS-2) TaxID=545694 RepID=F5YGZ3_TREPZ|nr:RidA family protein [Treponema primitia]AEF84354.1 endoribonuclease L-PSP [Treponema primitia ZAS-2]
MGVYERLKELKITLPKAPPKGGVYAQVKQFGSGLVYVSGCGPLLDVPIQGKLGSDFDIAQGQIFARNCMLNVLAILEANIGDLGKIKNCVKILTMVAGTDDFYNQPDVANGGTQLLSDLFGPAIGLPARSAIGVNALPGNIPVETEAIFEIEL